MLGENQSRKSRGVEIMSTEKKQLMIRYLIKAQWVVKPQEKMYRGTILNERSYYYIKSKYYAYKEHH